MDGRYSHRSGRQPVLARNVVATSQPLASQAGAAAFARGGNAIDAALAAAITLTVVEPTMNGIGGDAFALVWDGKALQGLNASGRAPAAWNPKRFAGTGAHAGARHRQRHRARCRLRLGARSRSATARCPSMTCSSTRSATRATAFRSVP